MPLLLLAFLSVQPQLLARQDLHTRPLVQKQGLKGPLLVGGAGPTSQKDMVLCGVLFFCIIFSLFGGVLNPTKKRCWKEWAGILLCLLLPRSLSLSPHSSQRDIFKSSSPLWISFDHTIFLHCTFILQITNKLRRKPRLLRLHSSVSSEDTSHTQSCYVNTGDGLWHLVKSSVLMLYLLQNSPPIEMNKTVNSVLKSAAIRLTSTMPWVTSLFFGRGNSCLQLPAHLSKSWAFLGY